MTLDRGTFHAIIDGRHENPNEVLGPIRSDDGSDGVRTPNRFASSRITRLRSELSCPVPIEHGSALHRERLLMK